MPIPTLDFETWSLAGYQWNDPTPKKPNGYWSMLPGARKYGIGAVGTAAYAEHPSTEVLTCSYDLCDGRGIRRWRPGQAPPTELFNHVANGGLLESHNAMFERLIWTYVCCRLYGWPPLRPDVQRCSMATAHVDQYPGALGKLGEVLGLDVTKDKEGTRLLDKFSTPRNPTKTDPRTRIRPEDDPSDFERLCEYCDQDVRAEQAAADRMEPMTADELIAWLTDQEVNFRGLGVDTEAVQDCVFVLRAVLDKYGEECRELTGFNVTQLDELKGWMGAYGFHTDSLDAEHLATALSRDDLAPPIRRVLELRSLTGSASVKKLYAIERFASRDGRLRNLFIHHGARTGRPTGGDLGSGEDKGGSPQTLNLPKAGPKLIWCPDCKRPHKPTTAACPWCGAGTFYGTWGHVDETTKALWQFDMVEHVLEIISLRSVELLERYFGDALLSIQGCIRSLLVAGEDKELIASDYNAIEAVVQACGAGEQWRIDAFKNNEPIYLLGASKITGRTVAEYLEYYKQHGEHHKDRQNIGKVSELACGFGGWIGSYKAFGSTEDDATIKAQIIAWRTASPTIVEMWGGQYRGLPWDRNRRPELFGMEGMAIAAIQNPATWYTYRGAAFIMWKGALRMRLPSGRELRYHNARLRPSERQADELAIIFDTWNSNPKYGPIGWGPMNTYGGRLFENWVQAVAHDIQRYSIQLLHAAEYPVVLHVYDENVSEISPDKKPSRDYPAQFDKEGAQVDPRLVEYETLMATMPPWAVLPDGTPWPIRATGGWIGKRYRKG